MDKDGGLSSISKSGREDCLKMVDGVSPSELGHNFADASVLLTLFRIEIEKGLENNPPDNEATKTTLIKLIRTLKDLSNKYAEASRLTGEIL